MAAEFVSTKWIYTVDKIKFTIGATEYPVSNLNFAYQHNGLPGIRLGLASTSKGIDTQIQDTDMAELVKYQNKIQAQVNTPGTKTYLEFDLVSEADTQTIKLEKWILQGAGIEKLGVDSTVMVSVLIMHPAYLARQSNLVVYNYGEAVEQPTELSGDNVYDYFISAIREYLLKVQSDNTGSSTPTGTMVAKTFTALNALEDNIKWGTEDGYGYPFQYLDGDGVLKRVIQSGIWNIARIEGSNPLDSLMSMLGEFGLCLTGSFDDEPLRIIPFEPWSPVMTAVYDDEINTMEMPSDDPRPVSGVVIKYSGGLTMEYTLLPPGYLTSEGGEGKVALTDRSSAGAEVSKMADLLGELIVIDAPQWLQIYLTAAMDDTEGYDLTHLNVEEDLENPGDNGSMADYEERLPVFKKMCEHFCKQYFWTMYRAGVQIALVTRFMLVNPVFKTPGKFVIPGMTISMSSRSTGKDDPLLYFLIDRVQHIIDSEAASAYTQLTGSFVRPSEGVYSTGKVVISPDEVKNGKRNPLWVQPEGA